MIKLGLTGSIAMGKSTAAEIFASFGVPVFDADAEVHRQYAKGGAAVPAVGRLFPEAIVEGAVDRAILSKLVLNDPDALARLQEAVHPLVRRAQQEFLGLHQSAPLVVLDIPLLFETGREKEVDRIAVVSAPADIQRQRALARPGMSPEKLEALLARQMPDAEKRAKADFIIDTSGPLEDTSAQIKRIIAELSP